MSVNIGDVYVDKSTGFERTVIDVKNNVLAMSELNKPKNFNGLSTLVDLKICGYKLKTETEEMTLEEVCEELGREIKIKK